MSLTSGIFFLFVCISLLSYCLLPKKGKIIWLLACSLFFLFFENFSLIQVLYCGILFLTSYLGALGIEKAKNKKAIFIFSIMIILGMLVYLKYVNLFVETANFLFHTTFKTISRVSPLGFSYYSLMLIGYLCSVYWGEKAESNPFYLSNFMVYFPIVTSGPFLVYSDFKEKIERKLKLDWNVFFKGVFRILLGLFKVFVLSSRLNLFISFQIEEMSASFSLFLAMLLYPFELYSNFSGSIDIIMGVSTLFGIELPENFKNPFLSETITEFWRRWHITLGEFLRTYIFYPLLKSSFMQGLTKKCKALFGKKGKKIPIFISLFILWITIGIWHGGAWKYIFASGILQFIYIFFEDLFGSVGKKCTLFGKIFRILRTYFLFAFAMVFFRAESIHEGFHILKTILMFKGGFTLGEMVTSEFIFLLISLIGLLLIDCFFETLKMKIKNMRMEFKWGLVLAMILFILLFGKYGIGFEASEFIYGKF